MSHTQSVKLFRNQQAATKTNYHNMSCACRWKHQRLNVRNIHTHTNIEEYAFRTYVPHSIGEAVSWPAGGNNNLWPQHVFRMPTNTPTFECTKHTQTSKEKYAFRTYVPHSICEAVSWPAGGNKNLWPQDVHRMPMKTPTFECTKHTPNSTDKLYSEHMYHIQSVKLFRVQQAATKSHDLN